MKPTQEKTMECSGSQKPDVIDSMLREILIKYKMCNEGQTFGLDEAVVELKSLLASSQDSFRRKVEDEKVKALKKLQNRYKDVQSVLEEDEIPNYMGILELEIEQAEQRAKLKNI